MPSSRREFMTALVLWRQALLAAQSHVHSAPAQAAPPYRLAFFTASEARILAAVAARIVPADERSGGAAEARVDQYIDFILSHGSADLQKFWRESLARIAPRVSGRSPEEIDVFLTELARNEFAPKNNYEEFFIALKEAVVDGFYTSEEGIRNELGYIGNAFLHEFPGCTHATHETPAGYRPLLKQRPSDA
jgi:gluconate 2-dehydrogenase gamma chain